MMESDFQMGRPGLLLTLKINEINKNVFSPDTHQRSHIALCQDQDSVETDINHKLKYMQYKTWIITNRISSLEQSMSCGWWGKC